MSLQAVGAIGELIAAIATVATLVYLTIQVRHNSRALRRSNEYAQANSIHDMTILFNELNWRLVGQQSLELGYSELDSSSALDLFAPILRQLLETKDGAKWWTEVAPHLYTAEFRTEVSAAIDGSRSTLMSAS